MMLWKNTINELTEQNKLIKLAKEMSSEKGDNHELKIKTCLCFFLFALWLGDPALYLA